MGRLIVRRLLQAIPALLGVTLLGFTAIALAGDPSQALLPVEASAQERAEFRQRYGLDQPIYVQYWRFLVRISHGDFGNSLKFGGPAAKVLLKRLPATALLSLSALVLALGVAIPLGILAAKKHNSFVDQGVMLLAVLGQAIPHFWLGLMLMLVFAVQFHLVPPSGYGSPRNLILPAITQSTILLALTARMVRSGMLEVLRQDYIRTAEAKGLRPSVVLGRHAIRNVLLPVVTMVGLSFSHYVGGSIITETVFNWPGIGLAVYDAITARDYPLVLASLFLITILVILVNLCVDILYGFIDPRIRHH